MATVDWRQRLALLAHPEGGYFRRLYTAAGDTATPAGARPLATSIYYLLDRAQPRGYLHRNRSDILHFLLDGGPVEYLVVMAGGVLQRQVYALDAAPRHWLVPGGCWKASQLAPGADHALVAEVVVPGFDEADHAYATWADLQRDAAADLAALQPFLRPAAAGP